MWEYEITLKNEKVKSYKRSLLIIITLNIIAFLYIAYNINDPVQKRFSLYAALGITIGLLFSFIFKKYKDADFKSASIILIVLIYYKLGLFAFAIGVTIIFIFYLFAVRTSVVRFSATIIVFPAFFSKKISWNELSNVILKDRLLTIDFKNNKLLQAEIEGDDLVDEKDFNDFCKQHLNK